MTTLVVRANGQIVIPRRVAEQHGLTPGSQVALEDRGGELLLRAEEERDPDQAWFWTPEVQESVAQARREYAEGRGMGPFDNARDLIAALHAGCADDDD
jgi:AbrB family looped-hinge helix DNA binding protein